MEKQVYDLTVDPEFEHYIPPLTESELGILESSLLEDGCIDPIIVWNNTIIDGHNRYRICHENNIPFAIHELSLENRDKVKLWMARNQLGRRNLKPFQRCELVYPVREAVKAEVDERKRKGISAYRSTGEKVLTGAPSKKSRDIIADMAGVSHATWQRAVVLIEKADENTKQKLRSDELSIGSAYKMYLDGDLGCTFPTTRKETTPLAVKEQNLQQEDDSDSDVPKESGSYLGWTQENEPEPNTSKLPSQYLEIPEEAMHPCDPIPFDVRTPEGEVAYPYGKEPEIHQPRNFEFVEAQFNTVYDNFMVNFHASLKWISPENATEKNKKVLVEGLRDIYQEAMEDLKKEFEKLKGDNK